MISLLIVSFALSACQSFTAAGDDYEQEILAWRNAREEKLRTDNGWLTLAGRFPLKSGSNTIGTGSDNDIVFPADLKGTGPDRLGTIQVDEDEKRITLQPAEGVKFIFGDETFTEERELAAETPNWVGLGRLRFQIIVRDGQNVLRLADNESKVREDFPGCIWFPVDSQYRVEAKFVPYPEGKTIPVVNVLDKVSEEPCPGYAQFDLNGQTHKLDAIGQGDGLFFVFKDATARDSTYPAARFLTVEKRPDNHSSFVLDFNKAYNPPCAVSDFTTCPTAPKQNVLKIRVEAGEKYRKPSNRN